ncbi:MAG: hypothetical protein ACPG7F_03640 [Aggregatilineales bacterium]
MEATQHPSRRWKRLLLVGVLLMCLTGLAFLLVFEVFPVLDTWLNPPPLPPLKDPVMI